MMELSFINIIICGKHISTLLICEKLRLNLIKSLNIYICFCINYNKYKQDNLSASLDVSWLLNKESNPLIVTSAQGRSTPSTESIDSSGEEE